MELFGLTIARTSHLAKTVQALEKQFESINSGTGGWFNLISYIRESFPGAWQQNTTLSQESLLAFHAVYACITLIASDIGKMRLRLVQQDANGIWTETESSAFSPVIRRPNHYQNRINFFEWWLASKLIHGNTYVLKLRDDRSVVRALYILDPTRVRPLVAPDSSVFYQLNADNLTPDLDFARIVPAREMIHDLYEPLFHPLVGISPLFACALAALHGLKIQSQSTNFFANGSRPSGVLTAPGAIPQATAERVKTFWETEFTGENAGRVAVLGDGLKYEPMMMKAIDAQLIEQLKLTAEIVCSAFRVPPYMIGVSPPPNYNNIEALNQQYYSQCLQEKIEKIELLLDEGFELPKPYGTEFEIDDLLRMDSATMMGTLEKGKNYLTPNEGRLKLNLSPVTGGDTVFRQQQDFSLEALNKRDSQDDPFATGESPPASDPAEQGERAFVAGLQASLTTLMVKQASANAVLVPADDES